MSVTYTFDIFASLDGYGSYAAPGDWGGYWGKQGPQFLHHRLEQYTQDQRMVFGATTFREFMEMFGATEVDTSVSGDVWVSRLQQLPATVISSTLDQPLDWPDATIETGDAVEVVARLKEESPVPLRSHGSLAINRALMAAGLVDRLQITIFPVLTGQTGDSPIFAGAADFDLELLSSTTFDGRIQELVYRPTAHVFSAGGQVA